MGLEVGARVVEEREATAAEEAVAPGARQADAEGSSAAANWVAEPLAVETAAEAARAVEALEVAARAAA